MITRYKKLKYLFIHICIMFCISYILSHDIIGDSKDIKDIYLYYFSYEFLGRSLSIIYLMISILPMSTMISIFVDSIAYELDKNAAYIFTRTKKRTNWLLSRLLDLLIEIALVDILVFFIAFIFFSFLGYKVINFKEFIVVTFELLVLLILAQYILITIANLISIKMDSAYGYITSNLIYMISILNLYYLSEKNIRLLKYMPFTQHLITLQDSRHINRSISYFSKHITGYRFSEAIIYDFIILFIIILIGIREINKAEFY